MGPLFAVPRRLMQKKPPHGQPCTRCGVCCIASVCPVGAAVISQTAGPCPVLRFDGDESSCGLVAEPMKYRPVATVAFGREAMAEAARHLIGSATGCDARFNGEPADDAFYAALDEHDRKTAAQTRRARAMWGV